MNRIESADDGPASGARRPFPPEWLAAGTPLTEPELALLAQFEREGMSIAGLTLSKRGDGSIAVVAFQPPQVPDEAAGLTLQQLAGGGRALYDKGQFSLAAASFALCLRLNALHVGAEHPDTLISAHYLASTLRAQGDLAGARRIQESVYETLQRVLCPEHPDTLSSANSLALTLRDQGDLAGARRIQESVVETLQRVLGPEHPDTLSSANNLASTLHAQGDLAGARRLQESVFEASQRTLGAEHQHTLVSANNLAETLRSQGDTAGTRRIQESLYEIRQRVLGPEHPDTLSSANNLAGTLLAQGDLAGARGILESVLETCRHVLGADHPNTLSVADNLANTRRDQGDFAGARRIQESVFDAFQRVLGAEHPNTLISANNLSATLVVQGDLDGASRIQEWVFETRQRVLGPEHPDTLTSANNLANRLLAQDDLVGARRIHEVVIETLQRVLGAVHPQTLTSALSLATTLLKQGDLDSSANRCLAALQTLAASPRIDSSALRTAAGLPLLENPIRDWPSPVVAALPEVLAQLSKNAQAQLLVLPMGMAQPMYEALVGLHERWAVFMSRRLPGDQLVDALLAILAPLHGARAWTELGQQAIAAATSESASPAAAVYADAVDRAQAQREAVLVALQRRAQFNQKAQNLQHVLSRIRHGEGEQAERAAADPSVLPRLQAEWEQARRDAEAARVDLDRASDESRVANAAVEQALHTLAASDPGLAGMADKPNPTEASIQATLAEDELWLVPLPGKAIEPDTDLRKWNDQATNTPSFVLAVRQNRPGQIVPILPTGHLALLSDLCRGSVRRLQRGLLRDGAAGSDPALEQPMQIEPLPLLQHVTQLGFWSRLGPLLQGIRRIHLVTAAGSHDLMLEAGRPTERDGIVLHRYCGLPAYWRSTAKKQGAPGPKHRYCWIHDESWSDTVALPFTVLDSFALRHRSLGQEQTADDLHDNGPAADVLVISSHGLVAGSDNSRGGQLIIGSRPLPPARLRQRRNHAGGQGPALRGLIALSCFGGVVGSTGHGDALGTIAALQAAGLQWAIACLAPVPDFYTPLFSAILLHELQAQDDPALALDSAKRILTHGPWDGTLQREVIEPLRQAYRTRMLELLDETVNHGCEAEQTSRSRKILDGVRGWSLPRAHRAALGTMGVEQFIPDTKQAQESFVDECLDVLLRQPQDRDAQDPQEDGFAFQALEHLAAVTVFFGRG